MSTPVFYQSYYRIWQGNYEYYDIRIKKPIEYQHTDTEFKKMFYNLDSGIYFS